MNRRSIRSADTWAQFDRWALVIVMILFVLLVLMWWMREGTHAAGCCDEAGVSPTPKVVVTPIPGTPTPAPALTDFSINLTRIDGASWRLNGEVGTSAEKVALEALVRERIGSDELISELMVIPNTRPLGELGAVGESAGMLPGLANPSLEWTPLGLRLRGALDDQAAFVEMRSRFQGLRVDSGETRFDVALLSGETPAPEVVPEPTPTPIDCPTLLRGAEVGFAFGSAELTSEGEQALRGALRCLDDRPYLIVGHTDSVGDNAQNLTLSEARAESVKRFLVNQGLSASRFSVEGQGESSPVASNATAEGRARNRRIEFRAR